MTATGRQTRSSNYTLEGCDPLIRPCFDLNLEFDCVETRWERAVFPNGGDTRSLSGGLSNILFTSLTEEKSLCEGRRLKWTTMNWDMHKSIVAREQFNDAFVPSFCLRFLLYLLHPSCKLLRFHHFPLFSLLV